MFLFLKAYIQFANMCDSAVEFRKVYQHIQQYHWNQIPPYFSFRPKSISNRKHHPCKLKRYILACLIPFQKYRFQNKLKHQIVLPKHLSNDTQIIIIVDPFIDKRAHNVKTFRTFNQIGDDISW